MIDRRPSTADRRSSIWQSAVRRLPSAVIFLLLLFATSPLQAQNPTFGVIESYEAPELADELGVGWTRLRFQWAELQPNDSAEWNETRFGEEVISAESQNRELIGLIIGIPDWARDENDLPIGLNLPYNDPANTWGVFVRQIGTRYQGQIDHWIIWNEPDIWDKETPGHTWDGTEADFAQLLKVAYLTLKEVNPDAVVHLPAMTFFWDNNFGRTQYLDRLLTAIEADPEAAANNNFFDVATAHLYFQPNQIFDILNLWRNIMGEHNQGDKPWWLVETNAPVSDDPSWEVDSITLNVSQNDQANFIPQVIGVAFAAGVERLSIYKLIDTETDRLANPEPFGLARFDASTRPGFTAYKTAIGLLDNITNATRERWDEIGQIRLEQAGGQQTHILFSRMGYAVTVDVGALPNSESATLISALGDAQTIQPTNGVYQVELPGSACNQPVADHCMIGGDTFYLIQNETVAPTVMPQPTVTVTPIYPPTPTPLVLDRSAAVVAEAGGEGVVDSAESTQQTPEPIVYERSGQQPPTAADWTVWVVGALAIVVVLLVAAIIVRYVF